MKKLKQTSILFLLLIIIVLSTNQYVFAVRDEIGINDFIRPVEYTEDFKKWAELSESEKINSLQPKMYKDLNTEFIVSNPLYQVNLVGASLDSKYDLRDVIGDNIAIRNQRDTSYCWAFSGLSALETNLALKNNNRIYDYSERHANYATSRVFENNQINSFGFNRVPSSGGQWLLLETYLTNGQGAIKEEDMPFENSNNIINISEIQNKTVQTRVYDTIYFDDYNELSGTERTDEINKIKQHIQNYGSVFASLHGDSTDISSYNCYNNSNGAKYCNDTTNHPTDHAVAIIGWDDNYAISNFTENMRPSAPGAWIARNSWGENLEISFDSLKQQMFREYEEQCRSRGWNSAEEIPNSYVSEAAQGLGYIVSEDKLLIPVGDKGYMYISYEDANVGSTLYGIEKASTELGYDYIYQYNELYPAIEIELNSNSTFICNIFDKQSTGKEVLTGIALTAPETYTCKVYVNPNGTSRSKADMKQVQLQTGSSEMIDKGYHTLEFASPVEITGEQFVVVVEVLGTRRSIDVQLEGKTSKSPLFNYVKTETGKTFVSTTTNFDTCTWFDLGSLSSTNSNLTNGDSSIKAFTQIKEEEPEATLERIEVVTPPTKVNYKEGENFEKAGLVVKAIYSDEREETLNSSDYSISNGTNLKLNQTSVVITYKGKSVEQPITVEKKAEQEPTPEPQPDPEKPAGDTQEEIPEGTDFSNAKVTLTSIKAFYYDDSSKNYTVVDTEVNNISRSTKNDSFEYYYYLSPKANLTGISDWVKITVVQTAQKKLVFKVDSKDIPNFEEVSNAKKLYIYIKEVATKGGNQTVTISKGLLFDQGSLEIETYVNGIKKSNTSGSGTSEQGSSQSGSSSGSSSSGAQGTTTSGQTGSQSSSQVSGQTKSSTASPGKLPATGKGFLLLGILLLCIIGIIKFVRYEILNKYVK